MFFEILEWALERLCCTGWQQSLCLCHSGPNLYVWLSLLVYWSVCLCVCVVVLCTGSFAGRWERWVDAAVWKWDKDVWFIGSDRKSIHCNVYNPAITTQPNERTIIQSFTPYLPEADSRLKGEVCHVAIKMGWCGWSCKEADLGSG